MPHPNHHVDRTPRRRALWLLAAAVTLSTVTACAPPRQPIPPLGRTDPKEEPPILGLPPQAEGITFPDLTPPLSGDDLVRANATLAQVQQQIEKQPNTLILPPATSEPAADDSEPPAVAIKYYLQGRQKYFEGATSEAIESLDQVLRIDPNAFPVLRLMGRACFASGQLGRGSLYLLHAATLRPQDVEVHYLLGRYWMERKELPTALHYFLVAHDSPENSPGSPLIPLVNFYLAHTLQAAGYYGAAGTQLAIFLDELTEPRPAYRYDRELVYLTEAAPVVALLAGENFFRADQFSQAQEQFAQAHAALPDDRYIAGRLIVAESRQQQHAQAIEDAMLLVRTAQAQPASIDLLIWTYKQAHRQAKLEGDLAALAAAAPNDPAATLALADVQSRLGNTSAATATLTHYLTAHPANLIVLQQLVDSARRNNTIPTAFTCLAAALRANPDANLQITALLDQLVGDGRAGEVLPTLDATQLSAALTPQADYLRALVAEAADDRTASAALFASSIAANPDFWPARQAYVTLLLAADRFAEAQAAIEKAVAARQGGVDARELLVRAQIAQERFTDALKLAQDAKIDYPDVLDVRLLIAAIYDERGQYPEEITELSAAVNAFQDQPLAYERLITAYLNARNRDAAIDTLARMLKKFPDNYFAQTLTADYYSALGHYDDAETVLRRLIRTKPEDPSAILALARLKANNDHVDDAIALLQQDVDTGPARPEVLAALADYYRRQNRPNDAVAIFEKQVKSHPGSDAWQLAYAEELGRANRYAEAETLLRALVAKNPKSQLMTLALAELLGNDNRPADAATVIQQFIQANGETPERLYILSHYQHDAGKFDETVSTLERILTLMPDHTGANNDLAYFLAEKGIRLHDAEIMSKKALENRPSNSAFIDTLGWVYYKQGRFDLAVQQLSHAVDQPDGAEPELLGHLGDALYRAGRKDEAQMRWQQSASLMENNPAADPEVKKHIETVLKQSRAGEPPDLAPLGQKE